MEKTAVIFGAAQITNYKTVQKYLTPHDFYIFCDGGMKHQIKLSVKPDLIIGDFDSFLQEKLPENTEILKLPCEKDDTDTFFAIKEACRRGFENFVLFGVIGNRFDHSLVNISVLLYLKRLGKNAVIVDDYSEMQIIENQSAEVSFDYKYFSVLCVDGSIPDITIKNAKYPLENAKITTDYQFGISNEVIPGKTAQITVKNGTALLVKVFSE